ncbi:MAG: DUF87 domain-containing protein [Sphingomonas sp.]|uniref:type IV secretory system conjugative DNA transfer family protein n=1 Tax=Sphingomonas sp. TaxID=28214 RepID=UPI001AC32659|nr:type IV secretion system DNA-binding domain-containing protein [Sphingomonas sp.]MBN8807803.1 DUF87 domain-containing protein [Sphingomonas sp.]
MWVSTTEHGENYYEDLYRNVMEYLGVIREKQKFPRIALDVSDELFGRALAAMAEAGEKDMPDRRAVAEAVALQWPENAYHDNRELFQRYERDLKAAAHLMEHGSNIERSFNEIARYVMDHFAEARKIEAESGHSLVSVPAWTLLKDARATVDALYRLFTSGWLFHFREKDEYEFSALSFLPTYDTSCKIRSNFFFLCDEYHLNWERTRPSQVALGDHELIERMFKDTPILEFFRASVPIAWRDSDRFAHTHIIGRTGSGKTTLIEAMVAQDIRSANQPSLVIITPHRELVQNLKAYAGTIGQRLVVVDPSDEKFPPAINPFHSKRPVRANHVIETFNYVLASLDLELTAKQSTLWNYTVRMLLAMPKARGRNATIIDIMQFLQKPASYTDVIDQLPSHDREYFYEAIVPSGGDSGKVAKTTFDATREEIGYRLRNVLFNEAAYDVLSAQETKIDFFDELNRGSVILVDTAKSSIGSASTVFGGMVLALIFQAMLGRDDHDRRLWRPTFVYVDECANYMSDDIAEMLTELRKFNCGLVLAHHDLAQATKRSAALEAAILSQPAIRFAHPSSADATRIAREMKTTPEFFSTLPKHHFGLFIHGTTPHAMSVKLAVPRHPQLSAATREVFKWKNRERVSLGRSNAPGQPIVSTPAADSNDSEWV